MWPQPTPHTSRPVPGGAAGEAAEVPLSSQAAAAPGVPAAHPCTPGLYFLVFQGVPGLCSAG